MLASVRTCPAFIYHLSLWRTNGKWHVDAPWFVLTFPCSSEPSEPILYAVFASTYLLERRSLAVNPMPTFLTEMVVVTRVVVNVVPGGKVANAVGNGSNEWFAH